MNIKPFLILFPVLSILEKVMSTRVTAILSLALITVFVLLILSVLKFKKERRNLDE